MKQCKYCGKTFEPTTGRQIYCSYECRYKSYRKKQEKREDAVAICVYCGKTFVKKNSMQKTHAQCSEEYRKKYDRERYHRKKAEALLCRSERNKLNDPVPQMTADDIDTTGAINLVEAIFSDARRHDREWIRTSSQAKFLMECIGLDAEWVRSEL